MERQSDHLSREQSTGVAPQLYTMNNWQALGSLNDIFRQQAVASPDQPVLCTADGTVHYTLGELDKVTDALAAHFIRSFRCRHGSSVAIFMEKSPEYVVAYIAALKAGGAYIPLDISYPKSLLEAVLKESSPAVVCTKETFAPQLQAADPTSVFVFDETWKERLPTDVNAGDLPVVSQDDLAYIVYSSGTTGKPKGIQCPHRGAVLSYNFRFETYPYEEDDRVACNVFFVWEMFRPILRGTRMYIIPDDVIYDPPALCAMLEKNQITRMLFTPSLMEAVLDTQLDEAIRRAFKSFRLLWLCGEVVTTALLKRIVKTLPWIRVVNLYSVSECHDVAVCDLSDWYRVMEVEAHGQGQTMGKYSPVGKLIPGVQVAILDNNMNRLPIGMPGEIYVGGPTLAMGYLNRPEINEVRFIKTPSALKEELGPRLYRTGDWGYLLAEGCLEICGRCDTMVKIRGYSIEIQAIESTLLLSPSVLSCAVVSIGAEGEDKQLAAYIVLKEQKTRKDLRAELKRRLPFYMVPSYFVFLDRLPVLPASSKVDKKALPPVDVQRDMVEASALPTTRTERRLVAVWSEVLGLPTIDIQESFFDLGGHSLLAARLLQKVSDEFGTVLSVRDLFSFPTVTSFARLLEGDGRESPVDSVDLRHEVDMHDLKDNVMDLHLRAFWRSTVWENRFMRACVLLTGATGFLGSFLLRDLLRYSKVRIVCLLRESAKESTEERLSSSLTKFGLMDTWLEQQIAERVSVIGGDVALVQLGLKDEDYHLLSYDIDIVIHAAAYVNLIYPYQALHGVNVLGTHNVLDFCHKNKVKPLHYISTDAVIPYGSRDIAETDSLDFVWKKLSDGYAQTKWVAEQLVVHSQRRGLPTIIYRMGNLAGEADTGNWNPQDFTYLLLYGCAATGYFPNVDWSVEMTPVDFTSRFIATVATQHFCANVGKTYHLMQTVRPNWTTVVDWIRSCGYDLREESYTSWSNRIESATASGPKNENVSLLHRLLDVLVRNESFFAQQPTYRRENTDALLAELGWSYPLVTEKQVNVWLKALTKQGNFPPPKAMNAAGLRGKVCVVTGASEGIGESIAFALAVDGGANVVAAARQLQKLGQLCERIKEAGGEAIAVSCDVTKREQTAALVRQAISHFGKVDVLINCAGVMYYTLMSKCQEDQWAQQIDVNCHGTMNCIGAVLPHMIERKAGHIVNITSDAGRKAFPGLSVYSGTKFFIEGMSSGLRKEMVEYGIRVTNIQPGDVATKLASRSTDQEARQLYDGTLGDARVLDTADISRAVLYALNQPQHVAINEILIEPTTAPT